MVRDRFKARFILGEENREVTGWDAFDIINKIFPSIEDALESAKGDGDDAATATALYRWNHTEFTNPGDMHRFDRFDFMFSFGRYACLGWSEL